jgi:hypothetical protein
MMFRDQNIFDSKKRIKAATAEGLELKLTSSQRAQIARNQALLAMFTAQVAIIQSFPYSNPFGPESILSVPRPYKII